VPKRPTDYHALAQERSFQWLGPEVSNTTTVTHWQCQEGHQWQASYNNVLRGTGCPTCAGLTPKTPAEYYILAQERAFQWLGPQVPNVRTKTWWKCGKGHQWESTYSHVQTGEGCPYCAIAIGADKRRLKPADYGALAHERSFRWLGPEVSTAHSLTGWECTQGHRWQANYNNIQRGRGCPICVDVVNGARVSKLQRQLCEMLDGRLNLPCGRYLIDVAICVSGVNIAVEYDSWYWHSDRGEYDSQRDRALLAMHWRVLHIKSNALLPMRQQLDEAIHRLLGGEPRVEVILDDWGVEPHCQLTLLSS